MTMMMFHGAEFRMPFTSHKTSLSSNILYEEEIFIFLMF
jgi:hypothetical protein